MIRPILALICLVALTACADSAAGTEPLEPQDQQTHGTDDAATTGQMNGEQLLAAAPEGWKQTFATKTAALRMAEFIPDQDRKDDWQEKVTFESLSGEPLPDPIEFVTGIGADQAATCDGFEHVNIQSGLENNYPTSVRLLTCNRNRATNRGRVTLIKAIRGNDYFYVVTRTKRVPPIQPGTTPISDEEMAAWATYLRHIRVCDPDREQHPCEPVRTPRRADP